MLCKYVSSYVFVLILIPGLHCSFSDFFSAGIIKRGPRSIGAIESFRAAALMEHNILRSRHSAPPLKLTATLNSYAQKYAERLAQTNTLQHSNGPYGENIYCSYGMEVKGNLVVDTWYAEIRKYNWQNPGFSMATGHFTQVIWKGTTLLGVGMATSKSGKTYVVASYSPPGNVLGRFEKNVLKKS